MIGQTVALFIDAYRELNAKKLFWITLILSGVFIGAFALLGVGDHGLKLLWMEFEMPMAGFFYRYIFSIAVVGIWVSWGALILALISTSGMFPDLIAGGAIDLYIAKPISRLRLFLTKYFTALLFVVAQSALFAVGSYLVMGWRGHQWRPDLFLIVPLVVCLFSYLYALSVLFGIMTRSTIAAILLTVLIWALLFVVQKGEASVLAVKNIQDGQVRAFERQATRAEAQIKELEESHSITNAFGVRTSLLRKRQSQAMASAAVARESARKFGVAHRILYGIATVLPKTGPTIDLLDRRLFSEEDLRHLGGGDRPVDDSPLVLEDDRKADREARHEAFNEASEENQHILRNRSITWVIGTSLLFEAAIVSLAAWIFCRRDY